MKFFAFLVFAIVSVKSLVTACTITSASGPKAPSGRFCKGDLIFKDNFKTLDKSKWRHEKTLWGGGNWEFQWYSDDPKNSFVQNGNLHLRPTYTSDVGNIYSGKAHIPFNECTKSDNWGCERTAQGDQIINPIRSAMLTTFNSFAFKYGTLEIKAKNPSGDWLWPALWLMPKKSVYGGWPRSGEIDLMETRGNRDLRAGDVQVGDQQVGSTLHFGSSPTQNAWGTAHKTRNYIPPHSDGFHKYRMEWTEEYFKFSIDGELLTQIDANDGFWKRGGFTGDNVWANRGKMAPFDQEFYIQLNLAVGGTNFFQDSWRNGNGAKPWKNTSPHAMKDFWEGRSQWEPTWNLTSDSRDFQIDYVKVWAA